MNNLSLFFFLLVMILQGSIVPFLRCFVEPEEGNGFIVQKAPKPIHGLCVHSAGLGRTSLSGCGYCLA